MKISLKTIHTLQQFQDVWQGPSSQVHFRKEEKLTVIP